MDDQPTTSLPSDLKGNYVGRMHSYVCIVFGVERTFQNEASLILGEVSKHFIIDTSRPMMQMLTAGAKLVHINAVLCTTTTILLLYTLRTLERWGK